MKLFETFKNKVKEQKRTLVLPEGEDQRVLGAAVRLANEELAKVIVLGSKENIQADRKSVV